MTYFNTTRETEQLDLFIKINEGQDKKCLEIIRQIGHEFSAKDVFRCMNKDYKNPILISSVRRSITTLKQTIDPKTGLPCKPYIQETGERVPGLYGRSELQYKLVK